MKNAFIGSVLVLFLSPLSYASDLAPAAEGVTINYPAHKTKEDVLSSTGLTEKYFDEVVTKKLVSLAYMGECGFRLSGTATLLNVAQAHYEDSGTEEISYSHLSLEFEEVILTYYFVHISGAGIEHNPLLTSDYQCK